MSLTHIQQKQVDIIRRYFVTQEQKDLDAWEEFWHLDAKFIIPYAPNGFPDLFDGRDQIVGNFRELFKGYGSVTLPNVRVFITQEPNFVLALWEVKIELIRSGGMYESTNFGSFRIIDDQIIEFVEFFNPLKFMHAAGLTN